MLRSGTPMSMVSVLLGHSHTDTTTKYATYSQETIKEAIESTTIANKNEEKEWTSNDLDELLRQLSLTP